MKATSGSARSRRDRALLQAGVASVAAIVLAMVALKMDEGAAQRSKGSTSLRPDGELQLPPLELEHRPASVAPATPPAQAEAEPEQLAENSALNEAPPAENAAPPARAEAAAAAAASTSSPTEPASASAASTAGDALSASATAGASTAAAPVASRVATAAQADGYRVQLGVFGDPDNASSLQAELAARGMPAHIQSRVVLGPYRDRAEAERVQAQLRKSGAEAGVLVAPVRKQR